MTTDIISAKNITSKLVLLGDVGPGKTSLVLRFCKGQFNDCQESTIGSAFFSQAVSLDESTVKLEIWDTAGQERYHCLAPMYYRGAAAAIIVYDITSASTFRKAKKWVEELQRHATQTIFTVLVGNKADLDERREVNTEVGEEYAKENGLRFYETSAKTGHNVNGLFHEIAKEVARAKESSDMAGIKLQTKNDMRKARRGLSCCTS